MSTKLTYTGAEVQGLLDKIGKGDFDNAKTLEGHPASYFAIASEFTSLAESFATEQGRVNTLYSYFNDGSANDALSLGGKLPSYYATATQYEILQRALSDFKSLFDSMFEKDSEGNIHAKLSLWSSGGITAGGVGSGGSGGGGGISYNRLDSWSDYSADKAGYVLSALLGKDLDNRVSELANAGYITASYLAPYALRSEIPSLVGYATHSWVESKNYLTGITFAMVTTALGYTPFSSAGGLISTGNPSPIVLDNKDPNYQEVGVKNTLGGVAKGWVGYTQGKGMYLYTYSGGHTLGIDDDGRGFVDSKTIAFTSDIPSLAGYATESFVTSQGYITASALGGYATQSWVSENYLSKSGGVITGQGDTRYVQLRLDGEMSTVKFQQRGIEKGAVGWWSAIGVRLQNANEYGLAVTDSNEPIYYWGANGSAQRILLHSGNYSSYALPITGGTVNGTVYMNGNFLLGNSQPIMVADTDGVYQPALYLSTGNNFSIGYGTSVVGKRKTLLFGNIIEFKSNGGEDSTLVLNADRTATFASTVSAPSFIGNLTGTADNASLLSNHRLNLYGDPYAAIPYVGADGVMEVGKYIDFHDGPNSGDYSVRIYADGGTLHISNHIRTNTITANSLTIGGVTLTYDSVNEALCINGNMYALGGITAGAAGISAYTSLEARVARLEQQLNIS